MHKSSLRLHRTAQSRSIDTPHRFQRLLSLAYTVYSAAPSVPHLQDLDGSGAIDVSELEVCRAALIGVRNTYPPDVVQQLLTLYAGRIARLDLPFHPCAQVALQMLGVAMTRQEVGLPQYVVISPLCPAA